MRGREEEMVAVLKRMEHIEEGLFELRYLNAQAQRERESRTANRHFWIAVVVPVVVGILTAGGSAAVTIIFKK